MVYGSFCALGVVVNAFGTRLMGLGVDVRQV